MQRNVQESKTRNQKKRLYLAICFLGNTKKYLEKLVFRLPLNVYFRYLMDIKGNKCQKIKPKTSKKAFLFTIGAKSKKRDR